MCRLLLKHATAITTVLVHISFFCFPATADCGVTAGGSVSIHEAVVVDQNGQGQFKTVQAAIDSIPSGNNQWFKLQINAGLYNEKVTIPSNKPCVFIEGKGRNVTIIAFDDHGQVEESATFSSFPTDVVVRGITFKNTYNRNRSTSNGDGSVIQAVAARVYGDKSLFYECGFVGVQDTLWDVLGRHYFYSCYIEGAVDFIFGYGQSYYEECIINATVGLPPYNLPVGYVTAQGRAHENDSSGFVFKGGLLAGATQNVFLGRAYGPYSRVIFNGTMMTAMVAPQGWDPWRFGKYVGNFIYSEVNCQGTGSNLAKRVPWEKTLEASELQQYSRSAFIDQDGWLTAQPLGKMIIPN